MIDTEVQLVAQPRIDTLATRYPTDVRQLRSDFAGVAWIGDTPSSGSGMMGPSYQRRSFDTRLFLPDTHWYDADLLGNVVVQVSASVLQVASTAQQTQGLVGAVAEPVVEFYEHPEGLDGVGLCLWLRGTIWSNIGLSYRVSVLSDPDAVIRVGTDVDVADEDGDADTGGSGDADGGGGE
ncbi:hypothetical protein GCM10027280_19880 [Micromonospora polyrhachis]|uniref:Uncharacterized protein n=1 Tax=Micromonospora polyrhachis TaxID=1282883 RepID=A0A7W7SVN8_9ACTN|nr:hypothetical protein [Micromonospora polyrhachis]MBB4961794.1 hypothetical protein [Micromonospora polyrhachis]